MPKKERSSHTRAKRLQQTSRTTALAPAQLRWRCPEESIARSKALAQEPSITIIGQDRALRALHVGLEIPHEGYNIFVTGVSGTGRTTTIKRVLAEFEHQEAELTDKCYVFNFRDPDSPRLIILEAGKSAQFKKELANLLNELLTQIPAAFESRRFTEQRKTTLEHFQERQRTVLRDLERRVKERGFEVVQVQTGSATRPEIAPVLDGNPVTMDQFLAKVEAGEMPREKYEEMLENQAELERLMDNVMREMRNIERKAKKSAEQLNFKIASPIVSELMDELATSFPAESVQDYLAELQQHVLDNLQRFAPRDEQPTMFGLPLQREDDRFLEFQVNILVDNGEVKGRPAVLETNPRFKNLFGTIERTVDRNGVWRTDFMQIKAGSILKADGGFLVVNAIDALVEPGVWTTLKRTLRNRLLEIQVPEFSNYSAYSALKPEPIPLNVKVIMIGDAYTYSLLYQLDDDFKKIFKIRSDFDIEMPNIDASVDSYVLFIRNVCKNEKLIPFDVSGMAETVEYGARLAGQQKKLSTRFTVIADLIREAHYWAGKESAKNVAARHVRKAIDERIERVRMIEDKIQEMIDDGSIKIDTEGSATGQVNGLSVFQVSGYMFGKPSRITARAGMGRAGIINIEREADMSGPTHNKGVLILSGYLQAKYAVNKPLVLSASIAFEQSYAGVDGDSASSTEIYALLSALSGFPLRQDLAVTGSVDQHGNIQPIGGVNQKIEGFFEVCKARGFTGTHGVLIPAQNIGDLMLRYDVVDAVRKKQFHIHAVTTIDEGIELLFGKPARRVHEAVDKQLMHFARLAKRFF